MKEILLCPSMMCADFSNLKNEISELEKAEIDIYHIDIMDGQFVPNFGMGRQDIEAIREMTSAKMDVHLMIEDPSKYIDLFSELGANIIYFHPEADNHPARTLDAIQLKGIETGLAINPGTSLESISELLPLVDYLLIMTVNPGFSGQAYLEYVDKKIEKAVPLSKKYNFEIVVDGAISEEKIFSLHRKGVHGFVLGTSTLFGKEKSYKEILFNLRKRIGKGEG